MHCKTIGILTVQLCICILHVTSMAVTTPADTSSDNDMPTYIPCPGAAPTCDAECPYGLEADKVVGCHRCVCAATKPEVSTRLPKKTTLSPEECIMRITECQIKFPYGFMTDDSCTMCISKDDIYPPFIPVERQPMILLTNPCIQGFDLCRIFCSTGYRTGPRKCQYCACNG